MHKRNILTLSNHARLSLLGLSSLGVLALIILALVCPLAPTDTSALDNASDVAQSRINVHNAAMVSIALDSNIDIDITPTSSGAFAVGNTTLGVTTNNPEGYKVFLHTVASNALNGTKANIASIETPTIGNDFAGNTWGYSLAPGTTNATDSTSFQAIPATSTMVYNAPTATVEASTHQYNLAFGVHVTPSLPAGSYSNSLIVSVVANPMTISSLEDLVYMQDMTSDICASTPSAYDAATGTSDKNSPYYLEPITKQLYDIRDGNMYWVAKLADGNCWMTQNLALNLGSNPHNNSFGTSDTETTRFVEKLTPADSDVTAEWTPTSSTNENELTGTVVSTTADSQYSWNPGRIALATPLLAKQCENYGSGNAAISSDNLGEVCNGSGFFDVAGWQPTFPSQIGSVTLNDGARYPQSGTTTIAIDVAAQTYDAHYLTGNYYQWNTAVAGTGSEPDGGFTATDTICPRGWTLPPADSVSVGDFYVPVDRAGSYYNLMLSYGYPESSKYKQAENSAYTPSLPEQPLAAAPFYLTSSGYVDYGNNYYRLVGSGGWNYSATAFNKSKSYYLSNSIASNRVIPSSAISSRLHALPVRCIAR